MPLTDLAYQGPKRGADRAVLLAHGAGADMNAATLTTVTDALGAVGVLVGGFGAYLLWTKARSGKRR